MFIYIIAPCEDTHCMEIASKGSMRRQLAECTWFHACSFRLKTSRLFCTAFASVSRTASVSSQPMQASVMLTPYLSPALPSLGTFWFPASSLSNNPNQSMMVDEKIANLR